MKETLMLETIIEDPCCAQAMQGPLMVVSAQYHGGAVDIEFHLPAGHVHFEPEVKTIRVPYGQKPMLDHIVQQLHFSVLQDDLAQLLVQLATRFGLRDSWAPRPVSQRPPRASLTPPASPN